MYIRLIGLDDKSLLKLDQLIETESVSFFLARKIFRSGTHAGTYISKTIHVPAKISGGAICWLAHLVLEIIFDADAGSSTSVALGIVDADRIRLLLHHVVVSWTPSFQTPP